MQLAGMTDEAKAEARLAAEAFAKARQALHEEAWAKGEAHAERAIEKFMAASRDAKKRK